MTGNFVDRAAVHIFDQQGGRTDCSQVSARHQVDVSLLLNDSRTIRPRCSERFTIEPDVSLGVVRGDHRGRLGPSYHTSYGKDPSIVH